MQENLEDLTSSSLWRALAAEFVGTLFVVLVGCGAIDNNGDNTSSVVQISLAFGLIFGSMVWCFNYVSGGHLNPAITAAAMVCRRVSIVRGIFYIISQMVGAIAGAGILYGVNTGNVNLTTTLGVNMVSDHITAAQGFGVELMITFMLVFVVLAATDDKRSDLGGSAPLSIGLAVAAGHLFAYRYTMAGMNSARSFGPAVIKNYWENHWVYWVGPIIGGILAALIYEYIFAAGATFTRTKKFVLRSRKPAEKKSTTKDEELNSSKAGLIEIPLEEKEGEGDAIVEMEKTAEEEEKKEEEAEQVEQKAE